MKYDDMLRRWDTRRRKVYDHFKQSGSLTATGKAFGISRERVRQIKERIERNGEDHAGGGDSAPAAGAAIDG